MLEIEAAESQPRCVVHVHVVVRGVGGVAVGEDGAVDGSPSRLVRNQGHVRAEHDAHLAIDEMYSASHVDDHVTKGVLRRVAADGNAGVAVQGVLEGPTSDV